METAEKRCAFINAMVACAQAEIAGMQAHDRSVAAVGGNGFYTQQAYDDVPLRHGITHNAVISYLTGV